MSPGLGAGCTAGGCIGPKVGSCIGPKVGSCLGQKVGSCIGPKVGILALQGAFRAHAEALRDLGATAVEVRTPHELDAVDAVVIPGGESTTLSLLLDSSGLRRPLTARLRDGLPAFGTCAGMILLARDVLDGRPDQHSVGAIDIAVRRNAFGRQRDSFEADLDVEGLAGGHFPAVFIRAPVVERVGDDVEVLARVDERPVLCRSGAVTVAAFHPELSGDLRLHAAFLLHLSTQCCASTQRSASTQKGSA